ncbi:MAG: hypothetical protein FD161_78 [Limisphaerales bacterium]|nr:MAG: hypothetical protein FD161_78 [Limisphaerales bacterium]KAG0510524.1 MAG: hypothetical protein E1N63_78 [Limisphaerales bacterium]TXT52797.1 MAG: hypothetical protein FD140_340 [Limisphaerales bacterium]
MTDSARIELLKSRLRRYLDEIHRWEEFGFPDSDTVFRMQSKLTLIREELAELTHPQLALT